MSKDKGFHDKLKNFFRGLNKGSHVPRSRSEEYIVLTEELENDLKTDSSPPARLRAIKEINELAKVRRVEIFATEKLWILLEDLLKPEAPREARHIVLGLFTTLCQVQVEKSGYLRAAFFQYIRTHNIDEDAGPMFTFLKALTDNGRDVSYFDEKVGPLILAWMGGSHSLKKTAEFMIFLNNFLKFNQSCVDQEVLSSIIQNVCYVACTTSTRQDTLECIHVLETVICYGSLPTNSLSTFLATLCRTVNIEFLCQASWKTVRHLLGTPLGHSGLLTMCKFMETADRTEDYAVIRGAVFFVGVSLWGTKMVRSLKYTPSTVLSSFASALEKKHIYVSYEILLRIQDLVKHNGDTLQSITWDLILEIIESVVDDIRSGQWKDDPANLAKLVRVVNESLDNIETIVDSGGFCGNLHIFYGVIEAAMTFRSESSIEKLMTYKQKNLLQCTKAHWLNHLILFTERNFKEEIRPALKLKAIKIIHEVSVTQLQPHEDDIIDKIILHYFKSLDAETNISVRQTGVEFIVQFLLDSTSKKCYEVLCILERIVNRPYESHTSVTQHEMLHESDAADINAAVNGLIQLFQRKIYTLPSSIPIYCYRILVRHLSHHYKRMNVLDHCGSIRYNIFNCFFKIRANSLYHLGFPREEIEQGLCSDLPGGIRYSPYLAVDHMAVERDVERPDVKSEYITDGPSGIVSATTGNTVTSSNIIGPVATTSSQGPQVGTSPVVTSISLTLACKLVVTCLQKEKDWTILELVLKQIPCVLENKALVLSKHGNDIDYLANALCAIVLDKNAPLTDTLRHVPPRFSRSDYQVLVFPIITSLVSYHTHLELSVKKKMVKCLELGLVTKCTRICILALSICSLEMKDTMHKLLPEVLLSLSKITPKVNIAIPVLEFLSTLIHLPRIFASFVNEQYMSIFAIAMPYTNPFKFNQYTVSLSHHVIAMWFLKCRLSFRRGFVSYIIKGLESNVWTPFEEASQKRTEITSGLHNEDSSNRKRSSSLTEQTSKRRERPISGHQQGAGAVGIQSSSNTQGRQPIPSVLDWKRPLDKSLMSFHQELTETCVDLMARYTFADCSALPTRFQSTNFLLNSGGHSQTWLSDNKIITITTSGCTQKELRNGLCDKCWLLCRKSIEQDTESLKKSGETSWGNRKTSSGNVENSDSPSTFNRRRHRSAFAGSLQQGGKLSRPDSLIEDDSCTMLPFGRPTARDDLHLDKKLNEVDDGRIFSTDMTLKTKSEHSYCTCWCQGWAEVHIRRPTGNTSWMMRIQNQLGNQSALEFPIKELSAMYMNTMFVSKSSCVTLDSTNSVQSLPLHVTIQPNVSIKDGESNQANTDSGMGQKSTPPSPVSPKSPNSPTDDCNPESAKKNPVRRSNSSPEMCSSWKAPYLNQQREIQEQDEEEQIYNSNVSISPSSRPEVGNQEGEMYIATASADTNVFPATNGLNNVNNQAETNLEGGSTDVKSKGNAFLCYDTIPEEIPQVRLPERSSLEDLTPIRRDRMSTISVMSPARRNQGLPGLRRMLSTDASVGRGNSGSNNNAAGGESGIRSGVSPGFVFLQLCAHGMLGQGNRKPIHLVMSEAVKKSLRVLDYIPPYETHKIGVVYVGPDQVTNEAKILQNQYGSSRYREFLNGLGKLIKLSQVDPQKTFLGGLSRDGNDGDFAVIWQDDVMQVIFHVATLMPNLPSDPSCNSKKRHIGNDYVSIVYNNSGEEWDISTIKCQFQYACVVVEPLDHRTNRVIVKAKPVLEDLIGHTEPKIVSDPNLPIMARQWALHSNLASVIFQSMQRPGGDPYASNWLERLRHIKRLRTRITAELTGQTLPASSEEPGNNSISIKSFNVDDFTEFV